MEMDSKLFCVNLACGSIYLENRNWINMDFNCHSKSVKKVNLLGRLPLQDESVNVVYCSHFIEHIPKSDINSFLSEIHRILVRGGLARFVTPDLEEMCQEYLTKRRSGDHEKAEFVVLEIIDQLVRKYPGGELGTLYKNVRNNTENKRSLLSYIYNRTGENLIQESNQKKNIINKISFNKVMNIIVKHYCKFVSQLFPSAFKKQNVSLCQVGEKHLWLYDFFSLSKELYAAGFSNVEQMICNTSNFDDFPFYPLDLNEDNLPRKGNESMFIEATKL
ncbi:MAG: methyltransferase domain-containing protein [Desulfovermiculus sp.]|nr:methyltransferase domain-containing protein [Desulfovermiculus sp.]